MTPLILASASPARRALLTGAGLDFEPVPANLDETALIAAEPGRAPAEIAARLAGHKALAVARGKPGAFVIGADQVLVCGGQVYQKAKNVAEARANLERLQGRDHQLISAVCVAQGDNVHWQHHEAATLTMKALDDAQIGRYLTIAGDAALGAVGGYELEGKGAWLFEKVEGDYFTILGLPLLPLLGFLAGKGFGPLKTVGTA